MPTLRVLSGIPIDISYNHSFWFSNATNQANYFIGNTTFLYSNINFISIFDKSFIDVPNTVFDLQGCNYLMFRNDPQNNKWYYAFITGLERIRSDNTRIYFKRDVIQTWLFDFTLQQSFIKRRHRRASDGVNVIPESVEMGNEYQVSRLEVQNLQNDHGFLVVVTTDWIHNNTSTNTGTTVLNGGVPEMLSYYVMPLSPWGTLDATVMWGINWFTMDARSLLEGIRRGQINSEQIVSIYVTDMIPNMGTASWSRVSIQVGSATTSVVNAMWLNGNSLTMYNVRNATFNTTPLYNNFDAHKMNFYPFTKYELYNQQAGSMDFKPEGFAGNAVMAGYSSLGPTKYTAVTFNNYFGGSGRNANMNRLMPNLLPNDISITSDYLTAFLAGNKNQLQNKINNLETNYEISQTKRDVQFNYEQRQQQYNIGESSISFGIGAMQAKTGLLKLNFGGAGTQGAYMANQSAWNIARNMTGLSTGEVLNDLGERSLTANLNLSLDAITAKQQDLANKPPGVQLQSGNVEFNVGYGIMNYTLITKTVQTGFYNMILNYFQQKGYAINRLETPVLRTRQNYDYIELGTCNITGNIFWEDMEMIKEKFLKGITFWHNASNIYNYNVNNLPLSTSFIVGTGIIDNDTLS